MFKNKGTALRSLLAALLNALHTDQHHWFLPTHCRGTLGGMDATAELTRTYVQRVLRWWAGKGAAAKAQRFSMYL
ncbi:hypothetical protein ACQR5V_03800 [Xanthomonas oryzae pv. oryzicola]|uniref:hypothetical protein n=1 Tax=Xanthomonas oryzae TaxID=347 RepID=UPI00040C22D7|nr:hypothetical protein [Xanthomonas oryzae]AKK63053.1 hypothetical protein FE36_03850 [Xanthomonas oryzae pv. oryzicola]MEC5078074.1 hypothetical protein [Xanthomonas oryzae pv. oryzicola]MEC5113325.1 hypothetical protein [Xanthomonas oryzae pv. oryzicola]QGH67175.1 hypothetical protein GHV42_17675 [Xanthomonas oryzae pv. oryzicola]UBB92540.1 hypothetical protein K2I41_17795 [Xanthomonas oryzae pv. oryzicola]